MGTYTTNYNLFMPSIGEQGWGDLVNGNFSTLDSTIKGLDTRVGTLESADIAFDARLQPFEEHISFDSDGNIVGNTVGNVTGNVYGDVYGNSYRPWKPTTATTDYKLVSAYSTSKSSYSLPGNYTTVASYTIPAPSETAASFNLGFGEKLNPNGCTEPENVTITVNAAYGKVNSYYGGRFLINGVEYSVMTGGGGAFTPVTMAINLYEPTVIELQLRRTTGGAFNTSYSFSVTPDIYITSNI